MDITKQELIRDYYQLELTQQEIADKHGCSRRTIYSRMDEYGLDTTLSMSVTKTGGRKYYSSCGNKFAEYQLIAIADGADPHKVFNNGHVHHINGCKYDNRKENLVTLTPEEHGIIEKTEMKIDKDSGRMYKELEISN